MMTRFLRIYFAFLSVLTILPAFTVSGQKDLSVSIREKFMSYIDKYPWEEVYLQTDRPEYISGEEIWFSTYLINRKDNSPSELSRIVYVELLNSRNVAVAQKRLDAVNGFGSGEILLPDTLATGVYTLKAYTGWMKNFLPVNCFTRRLVVYNSINTGEKYPDITSSVQAADKSVLSGYSSYGLSLEVKATASLPGSRDLVINADQAFRSANSNSCYVFVNTLGHIDLCQKVILTSSSTVFTLGQQMLHAGVNHITIFNNRGEVATEKLIYTAATGRNEGKIVANGTYGRREKVALDIETGLTGLQANDTSIMSVSVVPLTSKASRGSINDWIILGSEFGLSAFDYDVNGLLTAKGESVDSILSGRKSGWIRWDLIMSDKLPDLPYAAESNTSFVTGRLLNKESRQPLGDRLLFLSTPGKKAIFRYARTNPDGSFSFPVKISNVINDLIIQPELADMSGSIEIGSPFIKNGPETEIVNRGEKDIPGYIFRWSANQQIARIYATRFLTDPVTGTATATNMHRFYGKPDVELKLDDYIKLPVMQEVFFELLPGVPLRSRKNGYEIGMIDPVESKQYIKPPMLLIDGVVISDASLIANLDPEGVEQVDVVKERYLVGDYLIYGLVNVITRAGDYSSVSLPEYAVHLRFRTADPPASFWSPDYTNLAEKSNRIPDFRNTLYWNGQLKAGQDGKAKVQFWTSDLAGEYLVTVQGITTDGRTFSATKLIEVKQ
ncbi:MAG: hypothetical protein U0X39_16565 [Bacteroidales bacterium]